MKMERIKTTELTDVTWKEIKKLNWIIKEKLNSGEYYLENGNIRQKGIKPIHHFIKLPCFDNIMPLKDAFKIICELRAKQDPDNSEIYRGNVHTGQAASFFNRSEIEVLVV